MRSYKQYCAIAKALDVIGDRWNMLIVRELLLQGACRYTDLHNGLPGIATNLLAERLRDLEREGIVTREERHPRSRPLSSGSPLAAKSSRPSFSSSDAGARL
jgi:DNA-binding HxlR family transcriptional regulator